jgi:hypothetical protein
MKFLNKLTLLVTFFYSSVFANNMHGKVDFFIKKNDSLFIFQKFDAQKDYYPVSGFITADFKKNEKNYIQLSHYLTSIQVTGYLIKYRNHTKLKCNYYSLLLISKSIDSFVVKNIDFVGVILFDDKNEGLLNSKVAVYCENKYPKNIDYDFIINDSKTPPQIIAVRNLKGEING